LWLTIAVSYVWQRWYNYFILNYVEQFLISEIIFFFLLKLCLFAGSGKAFTSVGIQGGAQPGIIQQAITYVTANVQQQNAQNPGR